MAIHQTLAFAFGLLGTITSFVTFLAPLPTFYQIYKKKSTQGFQSIPYIVALLSAMLLIYYGLIKMDPVLIAINAIGCTIESIYLIAYLCYATKEARVLTIKLVFLMNILGYGLVLLLTLLLAHGTRRQGVIGWISMAFSLSVFAAPLCIVRKVIKTKSVEYMPLELSLFLTLGAIMWFFYGFLKKDYYIAVPNVLGFAFGVVQMVLYAIYRNNNRGGNKDDGGGGGVVPNKESEGDAMRVEVVEVVKAVCPADQLINTQAHVMMKPKLDEESQDDIAVIVVVEDNNTNNNLPPL